MGTLQRFKWQRALPQAALNGFSGFFSWTLKPMRQIPVQPFVVNDPGGLQPLLRALMPGNTWGQGKLLFIRGIYNFTGPGGGAPGLYSATDSVSTDQSASFAFPVPGPFVVAGTAYTVYVERMFLRLDPDIWVFDRGDALRHSYFNSDDWQPHIFPTLPIAPAFDYTIPMAVNVELTPAGTWPGATFNPIWAEAFVEQATNLGKLP